MNTAVSLSKDEIIDEIVKTMEAQEVSRVCFDKPIFYRKIDSELDYKIEEFDRLLMTVQIYKVRKDGVDSFDDYDMDIKELPIKVLSSMLRPIKKEKYSVLQNCDSDPSFYTR